VLAMSWNQGSQWNIEILRGGSGRVDHYIVASASRKAIRAPQSTQSPRLKMEFAGGRPGSLNYRN